MSDYVITQDISSLRAHKRIRAGNGYATHEADNLDQAGAYRVISFDEFNTLPEELRCHRCFPESEDDGSTQSDVSEA